MKTSHNYQYDTLSEAINDLNKRGYTFDFNLLTDGISHPETDKLYHPEAFNVVEFYRFEGMSSTDDESVVYAIETNDGLKGTLADAYGVYSDSLSPEMLEKMKFTH
ncbi:MAG: phosphoribosylpyrophosphate synthetase [Crocinitomicaceae bacterium]|nr:phosphoribosylpyrophosphate synthetase [Crocinitomicaceae bacterium]|tara:strand:+ start:403 stop:720 length:318 start_codon:yes stop_codon:yes gene_type:complete